MCWLASRGQAAALPEARFDLDGLGELAELQIDDDQASKPSVKKQQINFVPLVPDAQPVLTPDKRKIAPELKQESLEFAEESLFQAR